MKTKLILSIILTLLVNIKLFSETTEDKYKVSVHPITPSSGICTGVVIAYGHYIKPPYQVTMEVKDIILDYDKNINPIKRPQYFVFINSVPIVPQLSLEELKSEKTNLDLSASDKSLTIKEMKRQGVLRDLADLYFEESLKGNETTALNIINNYAKNNSDVIKNITANKVNNQIEIVLDNNQKIISSFNDLRRMGRKNKITSFVNHLTSSFPNWEKKMGQSVAVDMLYKEIRGNQLVEDFKPFNTKNRSIEIKFKEQAYWQPVLLLAPFTVNREENQISANESGQALVNLYRGELERGRVILTYPNGENRISKEILVEIVEILQRNDINKPSKIQMIMKLSKIDNELAEILISNFDATEYPY